MALKKNLPDLAAEARQRGVPEVDVSEVEKSMDGRANGRLALDITNRVESHPTDPSLHSYLVRRDLGLGQLCTARQSLVQRMEFHPAYT